MKIFVHHFTLFILLILSCYLGFELYTIHLRLKTEREKNLILSEKVFSQADFFGAFDFPSKAELFDDKGNKTILSVPLNGQPRLVFRFTDQNYDAPVMESLFLQIKDMSKQIGINNILLLTSSSRPYWSKLFKPVTSLNYPIYKINANLLKGKAESTGLPYLFILTRDMKVRSIFLPDEHIPDLTKDYFLHVSDLLDTSRPKGKGLNFKNTDVDLGEIRSGKNYSVAFQFSNEMKKPLVIYTVKTSCGCTVAEWDKQPIPSKAESMIKVEYHAEQKGYFAKSIRVSSNAENGMVELTIKGMVI